MKHAEIETLINGQQSIILDRECKLKTKDYIGVKIAMGVANASDYAEEIAQTEQWRIDINVAQDEIKRLKAIEPEDLISDGEIEMAQKNF